MSFRFCRLMVLLSFLVATSLAAMAQTASGTGSTVPGAATATATVHGLVVDPDDALVPGATVTLTSAAGKTLTATTKSDGSYSFRNVAAGTYTLSVKATGFAGFSKPAINVAAGANLNVDATLPLAEQMQEVNVTSNPVTLSVDPENNASSTVISGAALDALSDDPDELQTELTALAGPSAGPNGGQIYIDGFTGGQLPPKSSILSIRINQNPFSAQYDKLGYGRIEILTKPGTEKLHGSFNTMFGDKALNTSTPFLGTANSQPDYHTLFFMGNVTGPIKPGMSFTLSGSHRTIDNNAIVNPSAFYASSADSTTLCAPKDLTCKSYAFPTWARAEATPATRWDVSPRFDMMLGAKNTLTVRYQYESGTSKVNPAVSSALLSPSTSDSSEQEIQISETQLISSKIINETRFEYQHSTSNSTTPGTSPAVGVTGGFSVSSGSVSRSPGDHVEVQNYTSIQLTNNFVRFGGRMRTSSQSSYSDGGSAYGSFSYDYLLDPCAPVNGVTPSGCTSYSSLSALCAATGVSSYQCGIPSQFKYKQIIHSTVNAREVDAGLYAEDDWKVKPNLTLSFGIRYEAQNVIHSNHDFAPRVSLAYGIPKKNGKTTTVLRGGFGIFYDRFGLGSIASQLANNGENSVSYLNKSPDSVNCYPTYSAGFFNGFNPSSAGGDCVPSGGGSSSTTPTYNDASLRSAYTIQSAATVEQQVGKYASLSVTYLNARGEHQNLSRTLPYTTTTTSGTSTTTVTNYPSINQSEGVFRQNQINANINVRTPKGISIFGYYSANWANSNISSITDPYHPWVDYGRASFGIRNRMVLGGSIPLPYHVSASPMIFAQSGSPYNITLGTPDSTTQGLNDRPAFATGVTAATANCLNASSFTSTTPGGTLPQIPVNFCTGPANVSFNLRLSRTFGFGPKTAAALAAAQTASGGGPGGPGGPGGGGGGRGGPGGPGGPFSGGSNTGRKYNLTVGAMAQNLFNEIPYGTPISSLNDSRFGQTTSLASSGPFASANAVRRIMLQANFSF